MRIAVRTEIANTKPARYGVKSLPPFGMTPLRPLRRSGCRRRATAEMGHGPAFCEQKGTTAEGWRAADRLCKNLDIPVEACGARMPEVSSSAMTRSTPLRAR